MWRVHLAAQVVLGTISIHVYRIGLQILINIVSIISFEIHIKISNNRRYRMQYRYKNGNIGLKVSKSLRNSSQNCKFCLFVCTEMRTNWKHREIDISNISISYNKYRIEVEIWISPSTSTDMAELALACPTDFRSELIYN